MRSYYYYLSNVRHDSFTLEVPYLLPGDHGCRDLSNCTVVTIFDVRVRPLSSIASHIMRRRRGAAATIAAWSIRDNRSSSSGEEKCKTEFIELGRATFVEEQDCILIQDLIKRANGLVLLMTSAALKKSKFRASLYYEEEEEDDDSIIDITFSNYHHKDDQFGSEIEDNDYHLLLNDDDNNNNPPLDNNKNIDAILADLAVNTSRLFYSKQEKT